MSGGTEDLSIEFISMNINGEEGDQEPSFVRSAISESAIMSLSVTESQTIIKTLMTENQQLKEAIVKGNTIQKEQLEMVKHLQNVNDELKEDIKEKMNKAKRVVEALRLKKNENTAEDVQNDSIESLGRSEDSSSGDLKLTDGDVPSPNDTVLKLEIELLRSQLKDMEEQRDMILKRQATSDITSAECEEKVLRLKQEVRKLTEEKSDILAINTQLMQRVDDQSPEESFMIISEENLPATSQVAAPEERTVEAVQKTEAELEIQKLNEAYTENVGELAKYKSTCQSLENEILLLRERNGRLSSEVKELSSKVSDEADNTVPISRESVQKTEAELEIQKLNEAYAENVGELAKYQSTCQSLENEILLLREKNGHLSSEVKELRDKVSDVADDNVLISRLREEVEVRNAAITRLEAELDNVQENYRDSEEQQTDLRKQCRRLEIQLEQMHGKVEHLDSTLQEANQKVTEQKQQISDGTLMQEDLQQLREWAAQGQTTVDESTSGKIDSLEAAVEESRSNYDKLMNEYESLVEKWKCAQEKAQYVGQVERQLKDSKEQAAQYLQKIRALSAKAESADEKEQQLQDAQAQIDHYLEDIRLLTEKVGTQRKSYETRDVQMRELHQRLEESQNEARAYQKQADVIGDELQKSLQELEEWRARSGGLQGAVGGTGPLKVYCPLCNQEFDDDKKATEHVNWYCKQKGK